MPPQKQSQSSRTAAILLIVLFALAAYFAYTAFIRNFWSVPEAAKQVKNPLSMDPSTAAKAILPVYLDKCSECHGETGKGNGPQAKMYDPRPAMLTDAPHLSTPPIGMGAQIATSAEGFQGPEGWRVSTAFARSSCP